MFGSRRGSLLLVLVACTRLLTAQIIVSPASATLLVGESRRFRAVDERGGMLRNVRWTVSSPEILQIMPGDEVVVSAQKVGTVTLTADVNGAFSEAHIEVATGTSLPRGTTKWRSEEATGCKSAQVVPAVPVPDGPDVYVEYQCPDGNYIRAYTEDGILLWNWRISGPGTPPSQIIPAFPQQGMPSKTRIPGRAGMPGKSEKSVPATTNPLNSRASSICDSISAGMKVAAVKELLSVRGLPLSATGLKRWVVEEDGSECRLWFDDAWSVVRIRKTLVTQ